MRGVIFFFFLRVCSANLEKGNSVVFDTFASCILLFLANIQIKKTKIKMHRLKKRMTDKFFLETWTSVVFDTFASCILLLLAHIQIKNENKNALFAKQNDDIFFCQKCKKLTGRRAKTPLTLFQIFR
jgi:hypothetical protein